MRTKELLFSGSLTPEVRVMAVYITQFTFTVINTIQNLIFQITIAKFLDFPLQLRLPLPKTHNAFTSGITLQVMLYKVFNYHYKYQYEMSYYEITITIKKIL